MQCILDVPAPAKLNLFLHVTGQRADGYHLLQSAFMLLDWCDTLHFELRTGGNLSRTDLAEALPDDDLILRSARLLQGATGCTAGAHVSVSKQIPQQAGLGGGSSDAATTLIALNRLWGTRLARPQLMRLALQLGADVPFFIAGHNAWVEGIGEQISPIAVPPARFVILKPPGGLQTAEIFGAAALTRNHAPATIADFAAAPFEFGRNDLQPVAEQLYPAIGTALELLHEAGFGGRMTGSGSAVFALASGLADGGWHASQDLPADWMVRTCSNLPVHPLACWVSAG